MQVDVPRSSPSLATHNNPPRDDTFKYFIQNVLSTGKCIDTEVLEYLTNEENLAVYAAVFTHPSACADDVANYEFWEFLGDSVVNKCVMHYLCHKYSHMRSKKSVKVLARVKVNYISKKWLAWFGDAFHFWSFIKADEKVLHSQKTKLLEDVFEAFFGATEMLLDQKYNVGVGYYVCQNIMDEILVHNDMDLEYNNLFDAKTRLKELFDAIRHEQPTYTWVNHTIHTHNNPVFEVTCSATFGGRAYLLGRGRGQLKIEAQQDAAERALETMKTSFHTERIMRFTGDDYECTIVNNIERCTSFHR
jgi:dsRNA-specific ribonuclease